MCLVANPRDTRQIKPETDHGQNGPPSQREWKCVWLYGGDDCTGSFTKDPPDAENATPPDTLCANSITFQDGSASELPFEPELDFSFISLPDTQHHHRHRFHDVSSVESGCEMPALKQTVRKHEPEPEE